MDTKIKKIMNLLQKGFFGFWVKYRRFTFLFVAIIVGLGSISLTTIPKESSPDIEFGIISISTVYQGVNPEDMDNLITDKIEQQIKDIDGIKKITSNSSVGISSIVIELTNQADVNEVVLDIEDAVDKVDLPSNTEDPVIQEITPDNELMFTAILYGDKDKYSQLYLLKKARIIKDSLDGNGTINRIDIGGTSDGSSAVRVGQGGEGVYEYEVLLDKNKVEEIGLNLFSISQSIKDRNQNQPIGNHVIGKLSYDFRIEGEFESLEDLKKVPIQTNDGILYLEDIAEFQKVLPDDSIKRMGSYKLSGNNYISLSFNKYRGANIFNSATQAKKAIEKELQKFKYEGLNIKYTYDLSQLIKEDYDSLAQNGLMTLVLVFLSLLVFVGLKESIIATITIPLAFCVTFIVLNYLGLSLNFLTNFSFIITFGIAIDTTIVVIEGAHERMRQGFNPKHAILLAVRDYKLPLIAGTSTTVVVFLPLLSLPGLMGKFLAYIPITIFSTLIAALFISLTINSALYYKLSKPKKTYDDDSVNKDYIKHEDKILLENDRKNKISVDENNNKGIRDKILDKIGNWYYNKLGFVLKNSKTRLLTIIIPVLILILSFIFISPRLGFKLFPENDNGFINVNISAKKGTQQEQLIPYLERIDKVFSLYKEVKVYNYKLSDNKISASIELLNPDYRKKHGMKSSFEMETELQKDLDYLQTFGLSLEIETLEDGPPGEKPVGVKLVADSNEKFKLLQSVAKDFESYLKKLKGTKNVSISSEDTPGQFIFRYSRNKLTILGLTPSDFNNTLYFVINGISAGTLRGDFDDHDITLKYKQFDEELTVSDINNINIQTSKGKILIDDVTDYYFDNSINTITRENGKITISVQSNVIESVPTNEIQSKLQEFAKSYKYPDGISFVKGGETEENADLIQAMVVALFLSLFMIYGILVLLFNSLLQPIIIMYSVLMGMIGANIGLFATNNPYSLMFGIGFIALIGIVVNDAIVLIDRTNKNQKRGMNILKSIKEAGRARLQPIILTTVTTILGLASIVSDGMFQPLAVTIMFGIFFGSATTLFVIPAIYHDQDKIKHIIRRIIFTGLLFFVIFIGFWLLVMLILFYFKVSLTKQPWFMPVFGISFLVYGVLYIIHIIKSWSTTGQTFIEKIVGIKYLTLDGKIMSQNQAIKRFFIAYGISFSPVIVGIILIFTLDIPFGSIGGIIFVLYLILGVFYNLRFWVNKNNQVLHDEIVGTKCVIKVQKEE